MVVLDGVSLTIESLAAVAEGRDKAILAAKQAYGLLPCTAG
jgi:hypothetical protein